MLAVRNSPLLVWPSSSERFYLCAYKSQHAAYRHGARACLQTYFAVSVCSVSDAQELVAVRLSCPLIHWLVQKHDPLLMGLPVWGEGYDLSLCSSQGGEG